MNIYIVVLNELDKNKNCGVYTDRQKAYDFAEQLTKESFCYSDIIIEKWLDNGTLEDTPYYETGRKNLK